MRTDQLTNLIDMGSYRTGLLVERELRRGKSLFDALFLAATEARIQQDRQDRQSRQSDGHIDEGAR